MKKLVRRLMTILLAVVLVAVLAAVGVLIYLDQITKVAIETAGTRALGVGVTVKGANLSLFRGAIQLDEFRVANMPGYEYDHLIEVGQFNAGVKLGSLTSDTVIVNEIILDRMIFTIEQKGLTSNVKELLDEVERRQGAPERPEDDETKRNLQIDVIELRDPTIQVKLLPAPGRAETLVLRPGDIRIENVTDPQARNQQMATVIRKALVTVVANMLRHTGEQLPQELYAGINRGLQEASAQLGDVARGVLEGAIEGALEGAGQILQGGGEGVGEGSQRSRDTVQEIGRGVIGILRGGDNAADPCTPETP